MAGKFTKLNIGDIAASGSIAVWKSLSTMTQLATPTTLIDGSSLAIIDNSGVATSFDILVNGDVVSNTTSSFFDLSTLGLTDDIYAITVVAKADGWFDSLESIIAFYSVGAVGYIVFLSPSAFTLNVSDNIKYWNGVLEYSTDKATWNEWDGTTTLSVDTGKLYMRGTGNTCITYDSRWVFDCEKLFCGGNVENLLDYTVVASGGHPTMDDYCFKYWFMNCESLIVAPEFPMMSLTEQCYLCMFDGCKNLVAAPKLPATELAPDCYNAMFFNCTSLTTIPALPATTITSYFNMFGNCPSIRLSAEQTDQYPTPYRIPSNGEGTAEENALWYMFIDTGGTFRGTPEINTTYYLHKSNSIATNPPRLETSDGYWLFDINNTFIKTRS